MRRGSLLASAGVTLSLTAAGCAPPARTDANPVPPESTLASTIRFREVGAESGLRPGPPPRDLEATTILDMTEGGAGFLDYDGDGDQDILLLGRSRCDLYRNNGRGRFEPVADRAGLSPAGDWMGCSTGDFDNDGRIDIFLTGYRCARLYRNTGGRFSDVTSASRIAADRWFTSAAFADVDNDGDLDLYAGAYVDFGPHAQQHCPVGVDPHGVAVTGPCGPEPYPAQRGVLYLNAGGRFSDFTRASGLDQATGKTLGVAFADFDSDGDQDLYLANDRMACDLFRNNGRGRFHGIGVASGTAYTRDGDVQGGMGVDWGDYDGDGDLDLFVATYQNEPKSLYRNDGSETFQEISRSAGLSPATPFVTFGAGFFDADNDGWIDLYLVNGHALGPIERVDPALTFAQPMQLFRNGRDGSFTDVSAALGPAFARRIAGRGAAFGDVDSDGRCDLLAVDLTGAPVLLLNESPAAGNHWLRVVLAGTRSNRMGIGARVTVSAGGRRQVREVRTGYSYLAANDVRLLFGLGIAERVELLEVRWPSGKRSLVRPDSVDREIVVTEESDP